MPVSAATRASTQDASTGTPVAVATNEVTAGNALQAVVPEGNKSTYAIQTRTGIAAADAPTGGDMTTTGFAGAAGANLLDIGNAMSAVVTATCGTASAILVGRLALYDGSNVCIGLSEVVSFGADATRRLGNAAGNFVCPINIIDVGSARKVRFFVESVSAGTWTVEVRPV